MQAGRSDENPDCRDARSCDPNDGSDPPSGSLSWQGREVWRTRLRFIWSWSLTTQFHQHRLTHFWIARGHSCLFEGAIFCRLVGLSGNRNAGISNRCSTKDQSNDRQRAGTRRPSSGRRSRISKMTNEACQEASRSGFRKRVASRFMEHGFARLDRVSPSLGNPCPSVAKNDYSMIGGAHSPRVSTGSKLPLAGFNASIAVAAVGWRHSARIRPAIGAETPPPDFAPSTKTHTAKVGFS